MTITPVDIHIVDEVINNDEGGWKLTRNSNDPDGGWTFAGVTRTTWIKYQQDDLLHWTYEDIAKHIAENFADIQKTVYEIYDTEFVKPCFQLLRSHTIPWAVSLETKYVSCIINAGEGSFSTILSNCKQSRADYRGYPDFCYEWMMHYIRLVQENARAWQTYAYYAQEMPNLSEAAKIKPKVLRSEDLAGWFNRVERYR